MQWIAEHILLLLAAGWLISMAVVALSARASWRWFRGRLHGQGGRWPSLATALVVLALAGFAVVFASSGLIAMGPDFAPALSSLASRSALPIQANSTLHVSDFFIMHYIV